jgi:hypothetical protein
MINDGLRIPRPIVAHHFDGLTLREFIYPAANHRRPTSLQRFPGKMDNRAVTAFDAVVPKSPPSHADVIA